VFSTCPFGMFNTSVLFYKYSLTIFTYIKKFDSVINVYSFYINITE